MKVLLISPLPKIDPACGDVTYTQTLLAHPPPGVEYETYAQAIERGSLREHGDGRSLKRAAEDRRKVARELRLTVANKTLNWARKKRWLFWEPFRFFSVKPGEYDLIHVHVFSARFLTLPCPLVVSNAAPLRYLYTEARGYSPRRARAIEAVECAAARALGMNHVSYVLPQARRIISFTNFLKNWYVSRGIMPAERVDVVPIYIPAQEVVPPQRRPRTIGFIAKDFDAKGGPTLLEAFVRVRQIRPDAELVVVGCEPRMSAEERERRGIRWLRYAPREQLMAEIIPSFDVFAYPTQLDGQPLVIMEAMAAGVPVITSDYQAMPEMVDHGRAGVVSPMRDAGALAASILRLLDPETNARARQSALSFFRQAFSAEAVRPKLRRSYELAAGAEGSPSAARVA